MRVFGWQIHLANDVCSKLYRRYDHAIFSPQPCHLTNYPAGQPMVAARLLSLGEMLQKHLFINAWDALSPQVLEFLDYRILKFGTKCHYMVRNIWIRIVILLISNTRISSHHDKQKTNRELVRWDSKRPSTLVCLHPKPGARRPPVSSLRLQQIVHRYGRIDNLSTAAPELPAEKIVRFQD